MKDTRKKILGILKSAGNDYVSGEIISGQLGITRAAIWKHIKALKESGMEIDAVQNKGYRFKGATSYNVAAINAGLKTKTLGRDIAYIQSATSTNNIAKQLVQKGCASGAVLVAEKQEGGRGRLSRSWFNAPGLDICMSIILRPNLEIHNAFRYMQATALGLYCFAKNLGLTPSIKWPNDILINGKKLSGILLELSGNMDKLDGIILGIGININTIDFPEEIKDTATSIALELGDTIDRSEALFSLLNYLEPMFFACEQQEHYNRILKEYKANCSTIGKSVSISTITDDIEGIAMDIDDIGRLVLQTKEGVRYVSVGDVTEKQ